MAHKTTAVAGTRFAIASGDPATFDEAGFAALQFKNIGKIKNGGEIGKVFEVIKNNYLSQRGTEKRKGTFDAGTLNLEVDVQTDEGQAACDEALDSDLDFNFRVSIAKTGVVFYLRGLVTSFRRKLGGPNEMYAATIGVELNPFFDETGNELSGIMVETP